MIHPIQIISTKVGIISQSKVEIVDIIDLITSVVAKMTSNLAIHSQMVNETTNFT